MTNASEPTLFRLRVAYPKLGRLKYLGHLELIHTVEQIVRRAKLPYAVTQGFSPHMRIAYTSALPVGTSSTAEYFDVYLTELVPAEVALKLLQGAAPSTCVPLARRTWSFVARRSQRRSTKSTTYLRFSSTPGFP